MIADNIPEWATGCVRKRWKDSVNVLVQLIDAGLSKGRVTANDIKNHNFDESRVIGAIMKISMDELGFAPMMHQMPNGETAYIMLKSTNPKQHGRPLQVWKVTNYQKLHDAKRQFEAHLPFKTKVEPNGQAMFC